MVYVPHREPHSCVVHEKPTKGTEVVAFSTGQPAKSDRVPAVSGAKLVHSHCRVCALRRAVGGVGGAVPSLRPCVLSSAQRTDCLSMLLFWCFGVCSVPFIPPSVHPSVRPSLHPSIPPSLRPFPCPAHCLPVDVLCLTLFVVVVVVVVQLYCFGFCCMYVTLSQRVWYCQCCVGVVGSGATTSTRKRDSRVREMYGRCGVAQCQ